MKLFPRVLPVDIPLHNLSITASVRSSDVRKAKAMGNKIFHTKANGTVRSCPCSMFNLRFSHVAHLVNENMLLFMFSALEYLLCLHFSPPELKEALRPPTNNFGKVKRVFTSARGERACLQLLCCSAS